MPRVKSVKFLTEMCMDSILKNQDFFCERFPTGKLEDALDNDKLAINPLDDLGMFLPFESQLIKRF